MIIQEKFKTEMQGAKPSILQQKFNSQQEGSVYFFSYKTHEIGLKLKVILF